MLQLSLLAPETVSLNTSTMIGQQAYHPDLMEGLSTLP